MSEADTQPSGVEIRPDRKWIDHVLTQSFKYGAIFGVPIFIVLLIPTRRRGIESDGIGLRGALIAMAIVAVPFLLWIVFNLGMRSLASVQASPTEFRVTRWWGGRSRMVPQSASITDRLLQIVDAQGRTMKFSRQYWGMPEIADSLEQYNIAEPKQLPPKEVSAVLGTLAILGGVVAFILVVGVIVNVAARL